jgi:DNA-binding transcriptional regulator LsrR (DeoR family)
MASLRKKRRPNLLEDDLLVGLAWLYYVAGHNQEEIACQVGAVAIHDDSPACPST